MNGRRNLSDAERSKRGSGWGRDFDQGPHIEHGRLGVEIPYEARRGRQNQHRHKRDQFEIGFAEGMDLIAFRFKFGTGLTEILRTYVTGTAT